MKETLELYLRDLDEALRLVDAEQLETMAAVVWQARENANTVFSMGNGGSAATAAHSAGDWSKELGLRTRCLSDNVTALSAFANDMGYESVFQRQLRIFLAPGDVVIAYSGSGESPNVISAVDYVKQQGNYTVGLTGNFRKRQGGKLASLVDLSIVVATESMERIEDCHMIINHVVKHFIRHRWSG